MALLDTSGLTVAPAGALPDAVTQAALDSLPVTGIAPYLGVDFANQPGTRGYVDPNATPFSPNLWLIAAAVGVFVLAVSMGGRR